jgi:hypothetical protein
MSSGERSFLGSGRRTQRSALHMRCLIALPLLKERLESHKSFPLSKSMPENRSFWSGRENTESLTRVPPVGVTPFELGAWTGKSQAFNLIADQCKAAKAECLRQMGESRCHEVLGLTWEEFCQQRLGIARSCAGKLIHRLKEFGPPRIEGLSLLYAAGSLEEVRQKCGVGTPLIANPSQPDYPCRN